MKLLLVAVLLLTSAVHAAAQDYRASVLYLAAADTSAGSSLAYEHYAVTTPRQRSVAWPMLGGLVGGVAGMYGGVLVGASIDQPSDDITPGMAYGFLAGEMLMLPIGVHLANGRKGNFLADLGTSAVIGTSAVLLTSTTDDGTPLVIGAILQYAAVIAVERATAQRRLARQVPQAQAP